MSITTISPRQLHDTIQAGQAVELIDVRTPVEFREIHVSFARNVPLDQLDAARIAAGRNGSSRPLYVICRSGKPRQAGLREAGGGRIYECGQRRRGYAGLGSGGFAGRARGRGHIAGTAGAHCRRIPGFGGSALGAFVSPYWIGLAAFVGAGLVFAGITDTCGMGMLLARMPWNKVPPNAATTAATGASSAKVESTGELLWLTSAIRLPTG